MPQPTTPPSQDQPSRPNPAAADVSERTDAERVAERLRSRVAERLRSLANRKWATPVELEATIVEVLSRYGYLHERAWDRVSSLDDSADPDPDLEKLRNAVREDLRNAVRATFPDWPDGGGVPVGWLYGIVETELSRKGLKATDEEIDGAVRKLTDQGKVERYESNVGPAFRLTGRDGASGPDTSTWLSRADIERTHKLEKYQVEYRIRKAKGDGLELVSELVVRGEGKKTKSVTVYSPASVRKVFGSPPKP